MSKQAIALNIPDLSGFARTLGSALQTQTDPPSHLELMNMLARAAGFRNYQHLRAAQAAGGRLDAAKDPQNVDHRLIERALAIVDQDGRLLQWPSRRPVQHLCLWLFYARIPAERVMQEREVNNILNTWHVFGDAALIRREMVGQKMLSRNRDGSDYRRIEQAPPPEAISLLQRLSG